MEKKRQYFVMVGGMPQAGSTLCFNLIRLLAQSARHKVIIHQQQGNDAVVGKNNPNPSFFLVKQHDLPLSSHMRKWEGKSCQKTRTFYTPDGTAVTSHDFVITVKRDLRDTVASAMRKKTPLSLKEICDRNIQWLETWNDIPDYEFVYEHYKSTPMKIVKELASIVGIDLSDKQFQEIISVAGNLKEEILSLKNDKEREEFYLGTKMTIEQLTNGGKVGGYKDTLTPEQISFIETTYKDWLIKNGYMK